MRLRSLPLTALGLVLSCPAWAGDIETTSTITAATVFANRATVTRTAVIDLPAGPSTVVLNGLPESLFTDSLRAEGKSTGDVILGAIENKTISGADLAVPRERGLNAKIQDLQDQRALVVADQQALTQKQQFLTTLGQQAGLRSRENIAAIELRPQQWSEAAGAIGTENASVLHQLATKAVDLRKLDEQLAALQTELDEIQTGAKNSIQVRVPLETKAPTKLTLSISYQLGNATWAPLYDARLDTTTGKVALVQYGQVRQQTGEDWSGVKLTLSTAQPTRGAALPPLDPLWVNLFNPRDGRRAKAVFAESAAGSARSNLAFQSMDVMEDESSAVAAPMVVRQEKMKEASFQAATLSTGGFVSEYAIPGPSSVPADNTARKVMIGQLDVDSQIMVKIKPQVSSSAFLVAATKLGGDAPLLPGQASLFRDGVFIGFLGLPLLRPGEETDLGFGIDDQVVVKHRVMKDETGENGVVVRDNTRLRHTVTEVQNLHKMPVKVALLQTVPVPRDEKIKMMVVPELTREGYEMNVDHIAGQWRWTFDLKPKEKTEIGLGWTLQWPKDMFLSGLPF